MTECRSASSPRLRQLLAPFSTRVFWLGVVSLFFTNLFDVLAPLGLKMGIDAIEKKNHHDLLVAIGVFLGLMGGVTICRYLWRIYFGRFHHTVAEQLRNKIFTKLTSLGPSFFSRKPVGELMSLMINDVNTYRMAIGPGVLILLDAVFLIAMILPVMCYLSSDWTWKTLILIPFLPALVRRMLNLIHVRSREQQDRLSEVSANAQEIVSGMRVIKSFAQEENQARLFNVKSLDFEEACNRVAKVDSGFHPMMDAAVAMGAVILLWLCSDEVAYGTVTLGTFVAFHEYIKRMIWPMAAIGMSSSMIEQGRASYDRIHELLETETDVPDLGTRNIDGFESLQVRGLNFRYSESAPLVLTDLNFEIRRGETIGIVGPVGAGKSTLLHLLNRLYPVQSGQILLNGTDIADYRRAAISAQFSYVPQESFLFSDSVAENIALGLQQFPGLEAVTEATALVNLDREIEALPEKFQAQLGERGVNLSGGQKQRMTIARAMIRRSSVVMFDDSLSAVDVKTESTVVRALAEARATNPSQAVVIVSHRLATLRHADRILVLNRGHLEAQGTHLELLASSQTYRHLHDLQSEEAAPAASYAAVDGSLLC